MLVKAGPDFRAGASPVLQDRVAPAACSIVEECPVAEAPPVARPVAPLDSLVHLPDAVQSVLRESALDRWAAKAQVWAKSVRLERPFRWALLGRAPQHVSEPVPAAAVAFPVLVVQPVVQENRGALESREWNLGGCAL